MSWMDKMTTAQLWQSVAVKAANLHAGLRDGTSVPPVVMALECEEIAQILREIAARRSE